MHRIDSHGATVEHLFTEGSEKDGHPATEVSAEWLNAVQEEIATFIESQGVVPSKRDNTQLLRAVLALDKSWQLESRVVDYRSPRSIFVAGDRTSRYERGTRVRAEQGASSITGTVDRSDHDAVADRTSIVVAWDGSAGLRQAPIQLAAGPQAGHAQSVAAASVVFRRQQEGSATRDLQSRSEATLSIEDMGGGHDKSPKQNIVALQRCFDELKGRGGTVQFERTGDYRFGDQIDLPRDVVLSGVGYPGTDPKLVPALTRLRRVADVKLLSIQGEDPVRARAGRNAFRNLGFTENLDVSVQPLVRAKWADSIVFEHGLFWLNENPPRTGHVIDVEECWDWRFANWTFKHGGAARQGKHVLNIYNGDRDNSNDFVFLATRFQESGGVNINFDSGGRGFNNSRFWFVASKFEDARNKKLTPAHVQGIATKVFFSQTVFSGCAVAHGEMHSRASDWRFSDCQFANGGDQVREYLKLAGARYRIAGCVFESPPQSLSRYIHATGQPGEITGCTRGSTKVPLVGSEETSENCRVHHNLDFITARSGGVRLLGGEKSKTVNHGLDIQPSGHQVKAWFASNPGQATKLWVSDISRNNFVINLDMAPKADVLIAWDATAG